MYFCSSIYTVWLKNVKLGIMAMPRSLRTLEVGTGGSQVWRQPSGHEYVWKRQNCGLVLSVVTRSVDCPNGNELNFSDSSCFSHLWAAAVLFTTDCHDFLFKICLCVSVCLHVSVPCAYSTIRGQKRAYDTGVSGSCGSSFQLLFMTYSVLQMYSVRQKVNQCSTLSENSYTFLQN